MFADNSRLTEQLGGGSVAKMFADNRRLIDSILGRSSFAAMVGAHESVSHVLSQGRFASTFGGAALPRSAWEGVLDSLRTPLTSGVYESTVSAFETAYDEAGDSDGSTCWLVRLPPLAQLGLLLVLLQALDSISQSLVSLTGEDVPSDYQDGARILFALATAIYACIVTRAEHSSSKR